MNDIVNREVIGFLLSRQESLVNERAQLAQAQTRIADIDDQLSHIGDELKAYGYTEAVAS